ncbi:hypothetical protein [Phosphitispora fastidiosa]|uniref:hypothetical protein n=1 Tax=Phosphitispora fastidiosa TaxID=2837202 RepID=UPI001E49DB6A|nr:hypothetical protein [Phosphitispora fastidiosa]MBU7006179.1 hypothetical protein [Phosphitispora fastidiosa]
MYENDLDVLSGILHQMVAEPTILFLGDNFNARNPELLFSQSWSCVFTTLRQKDLAFQFDNFNRRSTDITVVSDSRAIQLNRRELSIVRLSGMEPDVIDPIDQLETTQVFLETIPHLLRSYGRILFDGLTSGDILRALCPQLSKIGRVKSVYFFGLPSELVQDPYILRLIEKGIAVSIPTSLMQLLSNLSGELTEFEYTGVEAEDEIGPTIFIRKSPYKMTSPIDHELLLNIKGFARLLNYEEVELADSFPKEEIVQRFQAFLQSSTVGFPKWYAYRESNGFHMKRYFEEGLYRDTIKILEDAASKDRNAKPIMLRGQACSGKTNALCALAYRIFHEGLYPVVYIPESDVNFNVSVEKNDSGEIEKKKSSAFTSLEQLLREIESKTDNPTPTLIVWDTSFRTKGDISRATDLLLALRDAGRQVQIVCTGYDAINADENGNTYKKYSCIDVDVSLRKTEDYDEIALMRNLLVEKGGFRPEDAARMMKYYSASDSFFASLYLFRELHKDLKQRLRRENEGRIDDISEELNRISKAEAEERLNSVMTIQMRKVMEKLGWQISSAEESVCEQSNELKRHLIELICCIALCTIYKERLPISIALRLLGTMDTTSSKVFGAILNNSLLVYSSSEDEEPLVYIRSELEASLIMDEYGKSRMEIIFLLLDAISPNGDSAEIYMMQNLLRLIGPNNRNSSLSLWTPDCREFEKLIDKLREFRENQHSDNLILQELTLTREICGSGKWLTNEERIQRLRAAVELAEKTIDQLDLVKIKNYAANLFVEWALLCIRLSDQDSSFSRRGMYQDISRRLSIVISYFPQNGFAYSACLWAGLRYVEVIENQEEKMELLQSLFVLRDILENEVVDENIDSNVLGELDGQMDSMELSEERFERSIQSGKSYGIFYKVRKLIGRGIDKLDFNNPLGKQETFLNKCKQIIALLKNTEYQSIVTNDAGCIYTLINVKWLYYSGQPIIPAIENQCIGLSQEKWLELYSACKQYLDNLSKVRSPRIVYLQALSAAHLPKYREECQLLFDELRKSVSYEKRTLHVISDENGKPQLFNGRLSGKYNTYHNRGYIRLEGEGFKTPIYFRADKLGRDVNSLRENMQFYNLSVATSLTGFQVCKL